MCARPQKFAHHEQSLPASACTVAAAAVAGPPTRMTNDATETREIFMCMLCARSVCINELATFFFLSFACT